MGKRLDFTTPVGRMIGGSLYEPQTTDYDGKPLTMKDKVTPRVDFSFGIAIPKTPGVTHWANEPWGAPIWALANEAWRNGETQRPDFSSKITDGDSQIPNKRNVKPCDREGYPGHWVIWYSGGYAPKIYNADGSQQLLEKDAVKPGYYIQVFGNTTDNAPTQSPGMYMNHTYVALTAYGEEIHSGPDVSAAGFGGGQLPPGASTTPPAGNFNPASQPAPPVQPPANNVAQPPANNVAQPPANNVAQPPANNVAQPPANTVPVIPDPSVLTPPAPPAKVMTAAANGGTYEQYIAKGWTDAMLIQNGLMNP